MNYNIEQMLISLPINKDDKYKLINFLKDLDKRTKDLDNNIINALNNPV